MGAFVSGLDAGRIYQTWPLMGTTFLPNDLNIDNLNSMLHFNNHSLVHFIIEFYYFIVLYVIFCYIYLQK